MTFTYASTDLSTSLAQVRSILGDTNAADPQLSDEEITFYLTTFGGVYYAGAACCDAIAAKYARQIDGSVGPLSRSFSQRQTNYLALGRRLRYLAATQSAVPYAGGISITDKTATNTQSDRVQPAFSKAWDDYPGTRMGRGSRASSTDPTKDL